MERNSTPSTLYIFENFTSETGSGSNKTLRSMFTDMMKKNYTFLLLSFLLLFAGNSFGQYSITGTGSGNTYTQNFDAFRGTAATIPTNWALSGSANGTTANQIIYSGQTSPSPSTVNGNNYYAGRASSSSTDYSLLQKQGTSGSSTFTFSAKNNTGSTISGFVITWNIEQLIAGYNRAATVDFKYQINGGGYVSTGISGTTLYTCSTSGSTTPSSSFSYQNSTPAAYSITITGISVPNGQTVDYQFSVANGSGSGSNPQVGIDDFTMYATAPTYTVTYNGNTNTSGTAPTDGSSPYASGSTVSTLSNSGSLAKTNYTFAGWNTATDGSGTSYSAPQSNAFTIASNTTLYSKWTYNVTYNANGATSGTAPTDATNYTQAASVTTAANSGSLAKTGYTFAGWNTAADGSGTSYTVSQANAFSNTGNITLYAKWTYNVTYNANGATSGTAPTDATNYTQAASVNTASNSGSLAKTGYTFAGWNTAADGSGTSYTAPQTGAFSNTGNITLYAKWTYNVTYSANTATSGTAPTDATNYTQAASVNTASNSGSLAKTGYTFAGWNTAADGSGTSYTAPQTGAFSNTGNITLYAKWTYNVTYDANGATSGTAPTDATNYTQAASVNTASNSGSLAKTGFNFSGWNTAADGSGTSYAAPQTGAFSNTGNITLYAKWVPAGSFTVTFDANGGSGSMATQTNNTTTALNTNTFTRTGYTFTGWNTIAGGGGTAYADGANYAFTANVTLYAQWTINTYTLTYDGNTSTGGSVPSGSPFTVNYNATVTVLGNTGSLVKTGYTFNGWNTAANGSGTAYVAGNTFSMPAANITLYAQWTINTYTLTYDGNTNTGGSVPSGSPFTVNYNATVTVLGNTGSLVKTGYTFNGWNTAANGSGTAYVAGNTFSMPTSNVTLYAQWTINTYTLTYDGNTNTSGSVPGGSPFTVNYNATVTVLGNTGTLVKTGYTFSGWNTAANGSGTPYVAGNTFSMPAANVTLYAQWTINTYTLTYDGNTSTGGSVPSGSPFTVNYNATVTVLGNTGSLVKTGYTFNGWNTAADGSGTAYVAGNTFSMPTSNVTLYAQWTVYTGPWEDFETGSKGSYAVANVTCTAGSWSFDDALIGTSASDRKNGSQSARIENTGNIAMNFNLTAGVGTVDVLYAKYGSDANSTWRLEASTDNGSTWTAYTSSTITASSTTLTNQNFVLNLSGNVRFRVLKLGGGQRLSIDDIYYTPYTACTPPTTSATSLSFSNPTSSSLDLNFTRGNGDSVLVIAKAGSAASAPTTNTAYNVGDAVGGGTVVYKGIASGINAATTQTISSLSAETEYYFSIYEYKSSTKCYQATALSGNRYTLSNEPSAQPGSGFTSTTCTTNSINLTFPSITAASITNADGYIIMMNAGSAPTNVPADGQAYAVNDNISGDSVIAIINSTSATTTTISGLNAGVRYYFTLIPYNANSTPTAQTYNYKTNGSVLGTNTLTLLSGTSTTSSVTTDAGYSYTQDILYANYQSSPVPNSAGQSVGVHEITIRDGGASADADTYATLLAGITFTYTGTANTIRAAALFTNSNSKIREATSVGANTITFSSLPDTVTLRAPDNDSIKLILRVTFGTTVTDNEKIVFTVNTVSNGDICNYSQFTTPTAVSDNTGNNKNRIEVVATGQKFVTQPLNAQNGASMPSNPTVLGIDNNKNQDLDWATAASVVCSTPAALNGGTPVTGSISGGVTTFSGSSLVHTIDGTYTLIASASGIRDTFSDSYIISSIASGTYRTTSGGNWPSGTATWERYNGSSWSSATPASNTTDMLIIRHAISSRASFAASSPYTTMIVESGGTFTDAHNSTFGSLQINTGGKFIASDPAVDINSSGTLTVDSGGVLVINSGTLNHVDGLFEGTENFKKGSTLEIQNWDYDSSPGEDDLIDSYSSSQISTNAAGYYFGNLYINPSVGFTSKAFVLVGVIGTHKLCQDSLIINNNVASTKSILLTNVAANVEIGGSLLVKGYGFAFGSLSSSSATHTVNGNLIINSNTAIADINENNSNSGSVVVNLKGDLIGIKGTYKCTDVLDAPASSLHFTNTTDTQSIDIIVGADTLRKFNMYVDSASSVKLRNNNLELDNTSSLTVKSKGGFNFGWSSGGTPLIVTQPASATGTNTFTTQRRSILKITSPNGIIKTTATYGAAVGNVQNIPTSNRDYNQTATYWYIGRTSQKTGDGINQTLASSAFGKVVICDLSSNNDTLTPTVSFALSNDVEVSPTGGKLDIRKGKFIETDTTYITGTNGTLYMAPGTLYKVLKGYSVLTTESGTGGTYIPRMEGTSLYPYILSGGTIELAGSGANNAFQTLRGDDALYNYANVKFSGANTYGSDYKNLSAETTIDSTLYITGSTVVDCKTTGAGLSASFIGNGGLNMDGGRLRIKKLNTATPELEGINFPYTLTGGTIEFYGTAATEKQLIRSKYNNDTKIISYYNIDVNASAANYTTNDKGNVGMVSSFTLQGKLDVNAPAVFRMDEDDFIYKYTGNTSNNVNIKSGAGLLYGSPYGITTVALGGTGLDPTIGSANAPAGNIRTSIRTFDANASYGFIGTGNIESGSGLPSTVKSIYVYKNSAADKVTLTNTVRADSLLKMYSGHIVTGASNYIELGKDSTNRGTLDYTTGYIVGKMRRWYKGTNSGNASGLFPLGEDVSGTLRNRKYLIEFSAAPDKSGYLDVNFNHVGMGTAGLPITGIPAVGSCSTFDVTSTEDEGYWIGTPESASLGNGAYTLSLTGENFSTITDLCQLTLLKRVGAGNWLAPGTHIQPTGSVSTPTVSRSGISGFSNFGFGGGAPNPLPVELISFTGSCNDGIVQINWTTATEMNSKQFIVQRSEDGIHYTPIAVVLAAGFSNQLRNYSVTDTSASSNSNYYRLIEVDNNNKQTIYSFIQTRCNEVNGMHAYYTQPKVIVEVSSTKDKQVGFDVYEVSGKLLYQESRQIVRGYNRIDLNIKNKLAGGIYIIQMIDGDRISSAKVIVQ